MEGFTLSVVAGECTWEGMVLGESGEQTNGLWKEWTVQEAKRKHDWWRDHIDGDGNVRKWCIGYGGW